MRLRFIWLDENSADETGDDAETLIWTPVESCIGAVCAFIPCMAPLRKLSYRRHKNRDARRTKHLPLATSGWNDRFHRIDRSGRHPNDSGSGEFGMDEWPDQIESMTTRHDLEQGARSKNEGQSQYDQNRDTAVIAVMNGASADPRASADSTLPINQIKVMKDLEWSSERMK